MDVGERAQSSVNQMLEEDGQHVTVRDPWGNVLTPVLRGKRIKEMNENRVQCRMCGQWGLEHHDIHYTNDAKARAPAPDRTTEPERKAEGDADGDGDDDVDLSREEEEYNLCRTCALCTNTN